MLENQNVVCKRVKTVAGQPFFAGLVYDEKERPLATTMVGSQAFYVFDDDGFHRHIEAEQVDRRLLEFFVEQLQENKDMAIMQVMKMMGKDDLLTKAALDAQMRSVDVDQILQQGLPEQARNMMGMVGFRVIVDVHGEIVRMEQPTLPDGMG